MITGVEALGPELYAAAAIFINYELLEQRQVPVLAAGPRNASKPRLPQVPGAGAPNADGSNHSSTVFGYLIGPTMFGRLSTSPPGKMFAVEDGKLDGPQVELHPILSGAPD